MTVSISCEALVWPGGLRGPLGEKRREKRAKTRRKLGRQARATSTFGNASAGGLGIDDPFNGSQLYTVLDFTDALIDDFPSGFLDGVYDHESAQSVFIPDCPFSHRC